MIELKDIDTTVAEKNFVNLLKKNETYFLNGMWGSGKTVFLEKVSKELSPSKLVELKLWEIKDERSVIEVAFSQFHRIIYWLLKLIVVVAVVVSILMTPLINLGLTQYFQELITFAAFIALAVTVWQFLKYKSDDFYRFVFTKCSINNKILIVDDFDRISSQKQEELYRLFNILKGRLPIVFVGDFAKVSKSDGDYLRKIIDKRIELPIVLHPSNIWGDYFAELSEHLEDSLSIEFKDVFIIENRNLRDRKQFNELVNLEFFEHGKLYHVQIEQQLCLIYLHLFYPEKYRLLRDYGVLEHSKEYQKYLNVKELNLRGQIIEPPKTIDDVFKLLLSSNDKYPSSFTKNRDAYLLYETVSNLSTVRANEILKDDGELETMLLGKGDEFNDFYQFVTSNYSKGIQEKDKLVLLAMKLIKDNQTSRLIDYVINQKNHEIMPFKTHLVGRNGEMVYGILEEWEKILQDYQFDFSQKLYFYQKYLPISFHDLGLRYSHLDLDSQEYKNGKRKDFYFLTYLSIKDLWFKLNEWDESIWSKINKLSDTEYLTILSANRVISSGDNVVNFDSIPVNKTYTVFFKINLPDNPHEFIDCVGIIENYIRPRLNTLTKEGYCFDYKEMRNTKMQL